MIKGKRGISPLIATVLLVGFTISIIAMLFIWWGDFVKQRAIKEELKSDAEQACMNYVDFEVKSAEATGDNLKFIINNRGSQGITGFRFRIKDDEGIKTVSMQKNIQSVSQGTIVLTSAKYSGTNPTEVEVFPIIVKTSEEGSLAYTCTNKATSVNIQ